MRIIPQQFFCDKVSGWLFKTKSFLQYWWLSSGANALHSPFVFALFQQVIQEKDKHYQAFEALATWREAMKNSQDSLEIQDFGAGSQVFKGQKRRVSDMIRHSASSCINSKLLFRLVDYCKPQTILELGTHLGQATNYLAAAAAPTARIVSVEGCPVTSQYAQRMALKQFLPIQFVVGELSETLPKVLEDLKSLDFVFIDANHSAAALESYFLTMKPFLHKGSVVVIDDIRWSANMYAGWQCLKAHSVVKVSIDLFQLGLLFFREEQPKQEFVLKYWP